MPRARLNFGTRFEDYEFIFRIEDTPKKKKKKLNNPGRMEERPITLLLESAD